MFNEKFESQEGTIKRMVLSQERMVVARDIASKHGITLTILNKPGEKYTYEGASFDLEQNNYFVEISGASDTSDFWREVDEVAPHKKDALGVLFGEFIEKLDDGTFEKADSVHLQSILDERLANEAEKNKKYSGGGDSN